MSNIFAKFRALLPNPPLLVGEVTEASPGGNTVMLPTGNSVQARGDASVGQMVFVKDGVIEGIAPTLPTVDIEL